jgi:tetratricopeptide (TPR) repeat protein
MRQVIDAGTRLPVRIGVNRGHVFAGEIGPSYRRTYTVMGDAVNLAARLMAKAPWGSVYATGGVLQRAKARFRAKPVRPFMVKGKSQPVQAFDVGVGVRATRRTSVRTRAPLVGRKHEFALLRAAVASALEGAGGMVEIVGETGSGKSRLLTEARELAEGMRFVHSTGESFMQTTPYHGWRDPLRQLLGLTWEDPDDVVLERLHDELAAHQPQLLPWLPLLAIVIDAASPSTPEVDGLAPEFRTAKLHEVVMQFLEPALETPTLVEIEHAHLLDEASAALLSALAPTLAGSSWLVIVTRREVEGGFVAPSRCALRLELGPLSNEDATALAESVPEAATIPPHVLKLAVERSGGSPEFLLDLIAAAAAAGGAGTLPESVESAAVARLDALEPRDRALVKRASVLGLSFHTRRLAHVLDAPDGLPDDETWTRLATIFARDPDGHVRFKRPVLREVAYGALPFRLRRELHGALADALEADIGQDVDADPAVLSLHYLLAGNPDKAWGFALMGADRAAELFAHADAARLYRRAIEAGRADSATDIELAQTWEKLAEALRMTGEPDAASQALTEARALSRDDALAHARLLFAQAEICAQIGRMAAAVRWVNKGLKALEGVKGEEARSCRVQLLCTLAAVRGRQGRSQEAARIARGVLVEAEEVGALRALAHVSYVLDWALIELGRSDEAVHSPRAVEIYRSLGDHNGEASVLNNQGMFAYFRGDWNEAIRLYRESAECAIKAGNASLPAVADMNIAEILSDQGRLDEAADLLVRCRRTMSATTDEDSVPFVDVLLGRLDARRGRFDAALERLRRAREDLRRLGMGVDAEFASLVIAETEALSGDPEAATRTLAGLRATRDPYVPMLLRIRGFVDASLGNEVAAAAEFTASLSAARERAADYDVALALDALESLGPSDPQRADERDAILDHLGIEQLPGSNPALPAAA